MKQLTSKKKTSQSCDKERENNQVEMCFMSFDLSKPIVVRQH